MDILKIEHIRAELISVEKKLIEEFCLQNFKLKGWLNQIVCTLQVYGVSLYYMEPRNYLLQINILYSCDFCDQMCFCLYEIIK